MIDLKKEQDRLYYRATLASLAELFGMAEDEHYVYVRDVRCGRTLQ